MNVSRRSFAAALFPLSLIAALTGCTHGTELSLARQQTAADALVSGGRSAPLNVTSPAFRQGSPMPAQHSADGGNLSPALQWSAGPAETKEFVLIVEDPDAPTPKPFVHWVAFRIPGGATSLPADSGSGALVGQGKNTNGGTGYFGPKPPPGKAHRYFFQLFALNAPLGAEDGSTRDDVVKAMSGKIVGTGTLIGTYKTSK